MSDPEVGAGIAQYAVETLKKTLERCATQGDEPRAWACGLARGVASWLRAFADRNDPPLALVDIPPEPDPIETRRRMLHDDAVAATSLTVENPTASISVGTKPLGADPFGIAAVSSGFSLKACNCQSTGIVASNRRADCPTRAGSRSGVPCACRCHPENRR